MRFDAVTIVWVVFALFVIRMALRMADGGAELMHFLLMGAAGTVVAALIALAGKRYRHWRADRTAPD